MTTTNTREENLHKLKLMAAVAAVLVSSPALAAEITAWVQKNFTPMDVGGTTVYDLAS